MPLRMVYEPGDTIYYPKISIPSDKPMIVKDRYIGQGENGYFAQYLTDDLLDRLVEDMHENVEDHNDNVVVITGPEKGTGERIGKSNLAYWVAKKYDPDFNLADSYIYDVEPFVEKIESRKFHGKVIMLDEATNLLSGRDWMSTKNKAVDQILEMFGSDNMTIILCIPKLYRLDEYVRESRMRYHLTCYKRYWENDTVSKRGYFELKKEPSFNTVCYGTFPEIPPEDQAAYHYLKSQSQKKKATELLERIREESAGGSRLAKSAGYNRSLANMLLADGYTYQEIADRTGIPEGTLRYWKCKGADDDE